MKGEYRLLPLTVEDAFSNMAKDEAISRAVGRGDAPPTLRFYRWKPSAVSIGCFQGLKYEVDVEKAYQKGIDVVRRITGGGTVFHDYGGELTYSFVSRLDAVPRDIVSSFRKICGGLVEGLKNLGLNARYVKVNDVVVDEKKISGSAQTRRRGSILQHGTILLDPDIKLMFELLKVSSEKISDKFVSSVYESVTSISRELGEKPGFDDLRREMIHGFERVFDSGFYEDKLTEMEICMAEGLREIYASEEWTWKR